MTKLFGVDIGKVLADTIPQGAQGFPAAYLIKVAFAARDNADTTGGRVATETSYTTRGILEQTRKGPQRNDEDARVYLLAQPLGAVVPVANDLVRVIDPTTDTYARWRIVAVDTDPAGAGHYCTVRPA